MSRYYKFALRVVIFLIVYPKKLILRLFSSNEIRKGNNVKVLLPLMTNGRGEISFDEGTIIGVMDSPGYLSSYNYIEARNKSSVVSIGKNCIVNNNVTIISEGEGICIGDDVLIGFNVTILDSDFHQIEKDKRKTGKAKSKKVTIENNAFIGSNVSILKGVSIGENSVVGMGSVVVNDVPSDSIVAGNPAKIIKGL